MKTLKRLARLNIDWTEDSWAPKISFARFAIPVPRLSPLPLAPLNHRCYSYAVTHISLFTSRGSRGFTLIELLVVIGIIAILAGILLPVIAGVKDRAKVQIARSEMTSLVGAISAYEAEYSRPPGSQQVEQHAANGNDFTFGTVDMNGNVLPDRDGQPLDRIENPPVNAPAVTHQTNNSVVMRVILDLDVYPNRDHARNPRRHVTYQAKPSTGPGVPGIDRDGIMRDPWGNPYIMTIDMNEDNKCTNAFYGEINAPVIIWSLGKDAKSGSNKDNVTSWK